MSSGDLFLGHQRRHVTKTNTWVWVRQVGGHGDL